jgi:hypothetical protein
LDVESSVSAAAPAAPPAVAAAAAGTPAPRLEPVQSASNVSQVAPLSGPLSWQAPGPMLEWPVIHFNPGG